MATTGNLDRAQETFVKNIEEMTGRTIDQLATEAKTSGTKHGEIVKFVQTRYGLTYGYANFIALRAREVAAPADRPDDPVAAHYTGAKASLRPIYDALAGAVAAFGKDVEFAPKKSYVSLRRHKQFGCIHPSTNTRVDVGLNLKGVAPVGRLEQSTDGMFTHRVRVGSVADVDGELVTWLKRAYDAA